MRRHVALVTGVAVAAAACGPSPAYVQAEEPPITIAPPPASSASAPESAPLAIGGETPMVARAVRVNPFTLGSTWYGTYSCPQGETDLNIHVSAVHGNSIDDALFDFNYARSSAGTFHLSGKFDPESGRTVLNAGDWIVQPGATWSTVGMDGSVDATGTRYEGKILAAGCSWFRLKKQ